MRIFTKAEIRIILREILLFQVREARSPDEALAILKNFYSWSEDQWFDSEEARILVLLSLGVKRCAGELYHGLISVSSTKEQWYIMSWGPYRVNMFSDPSFFKIGNQSVNIHGIELFCYSDNYFLISKKNKVVIYYKNLDTIVYEGEELTASSYPHVIIYYQMVERGDGSLLICNEDFSQLNFYLLKEKRLSKFSVFKGSSLLYCFKHGFIYKEKTGFMFQNYCGGSPVHIQLPEVFYHRTPFSCSSHGVDFIVSNNFVRNEYQIFVLDVETHDVMWKCKSNRMIRVINGLIQTDEGMRDLITGNLLCPKFSYEISTVTRGEASSNTEWKLYFHFDSS